MKKLVPGRRACDLEPTQLLRGSGNWLIGAAGCAMEEGLNQAAAGDLKQMGSDLRRGPIEITTATGHSHQLSATREGI